MSTDTKTNIKTDTQTNHKQSTDDEQSTIISTTATQSQNPPQNLSIPIGLILLDMDGVCADLDGSVVEALAINDKLPSHVITQTITKRTEFEYNPEMDRKTKGIMSQQGFYASLKPMPGFLDAYQQIKAMGFHVKFCSSPKFEAVKQVHNMMAITDTTKTFEFNQEGYMSLHVQDAEQRKQYHIWAHEHKYLHLSYVDKKYAADEVTKYRCLTCQKWVLSEDAIFYPCCADENGDQACDGTCVWRCAVCQEIIWSSDWTRDRTIDSINMRDSTNYKASTYKRRNAILIIADTNISSPSNKALFQRFGLGRKHIKKQLKQQAEKA